MPEEQKQTPEQPAPEPEIQPTELVVHDKKLFEVVDHGIWKEYKEQETVKAVDNTDPVWTGPKIPWDIWQDIVGWCQVTQEKFKSEALVFLFLDQETNEWKHWYCPQKTCGMTVSSNPDHAEWENQRRLYPDLQFGTVHHHCTSSAFASGVDKSDEDDREGLHFTIGKLEEAVHDVHFRFSIKGASYEAPAHTVIEPCPSLHGIPEKYIMKIHKEMIIEPVNTDEMDFTLPLKNVEKETYQSHTGHLGYGYDYRQRYGHGYIGNTKNNRKNQNPILPYTGTPKELADSEFNTFTDSDLINLTDQLCEDLEENGYLTETATEFFTNSSTATILQSAITVWNLKPTSKLDQEYHKDYKNAVVKTVLEFTRHRLMGMPSTREINFTAALLTNVQNHAQAEEALR